MADLSLGAAALSAGIATWLFFSANSGSTDAPKRGDGGTAPRFAVVPLLGGSGAALFVKRGAGFSRPHRVLSLMSIP